MMSQHDKMKEFYKTYASNKERVVAEYAAAERKGEVKRDSNKNKFTPEEYALRLWNDGTGSGLGKGWLLAQ